MINHEQGYTNDLITYSDVIIKFVKDINFASVPRSMQILGITND